jgi:type I restriction enzyme S subunit
MHKWRESELSSLAEISSGGTPSRNVSQYWGGNISWVTPSDITKCQTNYIERTNEKITEKGLAASSATLLPAGTILLTSRATIGEAKISKTPMATNQGFKNLVPRNVVDLVFLFYQVGRLGNEFRRYSAGSTFLEINRKDVGRVLVPHPKSKDIQKKIGVILTTIDQSIEKTEALIKKYQQIKTGLMHDLFTRGIGDDGKLRPPREQAPELYQKTAIGWIPKEWKVQTISECGEVKLGRQRSPDQHSGKWTTPYLRVANVFDGYFKFDDVLEMDFTPNERAMFSVRSGDILLNEGQSLELVGRSALYQGDDNEYCFQNTLVRFRCNSLHDPMFFAHLFKSYLDTGVFMSIASQTTSVAHLGADRFSRLQCFIPPYFEQQAIAEKIGKIDSKIGEESRVLSKYRDQKKGLMHDLLSGAVEVSVARINEAAPL